MPSPRRKSRRPKSPRLHIYSVLAWGDAYHLRTGRWPTAYSGEIREAPWDTWRNVDYALRRGYRGCRPGNSLAIVFHRYRGRPLPVSGPRPRITLKEILVWADDFQRRMERWPSQSSKGPVAAGRRETWKGLDLALRRGLRGLPGDDSLALLLMRCRGVRRAIHRPHLTIKQILVWADAHHARTGRWPSFKSGPVVGAPGERWSSLHSTLERGGRGLPTGYTLAKLLVKYRGQPYRRDMPPFTEREILAWADAYHRRHDRWPTLYAGPIPEARGTTWRKVESALSKGQRGLPGGDSLSQFLMRNKRRPFHDWRTNRCVRRTRLAVEQVLAWADEFHRRHGRWPATLSGPIKGVPDETWRSVDNALRDGLRGLPGGSSLILLFEKRRGARHKHHRPKFTTRDLLAWADAFYRRQQRWPSPASGPIPESHGDNWCAVENALRHGRRGLPGRSSLTKFLRRHHRLSAAGRRA